VSAAPERTAAELNEILVATTRPAPYAQPDAEGHDPIYGFGVVDPVAALEAAMTPGPTTTSGAGGAGGAAEGGASPTAATGGEVAESDDDGGCGCAAPGQPVRGGIVASLLALTALLGARRRR
jgi:serine protease